MCTPRAGAAALPTFVRFCMRERSSRSSFHTTSVSPVVRALRHVANSGLLNRRTRGLVGEEALASCPLQGGQLSLVQKYMWHAAYRSEAT